MKLFDAHCHLQDPRILNKAPKLISTALDSGLLNFAVNGVSEKDWHLVKEMGDKYPSVIPCFGVHPWYVPHRSPNWFTTLKEFFETTPSAAVGEIGLDKGSKGREIDFNDQIEVFRQQLELAKELKKPASVHCVRAFGDLLHIVKDIGSFPDGLLLHSYLGSAEMVPEFVKSGAYFSLSGYIMPMKVQKAKKMLKTIPLERILLESDAPDALPHLELSSLFLVDEDPSLPQEIFAHGRTAASNVSTSSDTSRDAYSLPKDMLNHPANIHNVLDYVANLLEIRKEELAEISYKNSIRLFSYQGSKFALG
ncbi:hypothetical protein E1A91_A11G247900v1 [Gossypium mustelinum]|uniref:TatD related DNase n=5 Tax=Gossypium TaxID=3633 RepID=A0A5J5TRV8_GOSBA|nr:hypothetical protein ES319_A11G239900v1 [Gossypium barbadense]TYG95330.1 hypothetical protein ES288_A11G259600v1 [Gossypium darwinii]TYJ11031.1 hypothetical protein E1A91_A11G247900v1 [Gossypium mustelinum]